MGSYPTSPRAAFIAWCQGRAPTWVTNALSIGLSAERASEYETAVADAVAAIAAQETAHQAAKMATEAASASVSVLRTMTGENVKTIRAFAAVSSEPENVYQLAQIPAPASPSPVPPPAQPTDIKVTIDPSSGALTLRWKASNPAGAAGTSYIVRRRAEGEPSFSFIGVTGSKSFTDETFIAGPDSVEYTVQGTRSGINGPLSSIFLVRFGALPGGAGFQAFVTEQVGSSAKLAA